MNSSCLPDLYHVWLIGTSVESIRELIEVPPEIESALRLYAREHLEDAAGIERTLKFRTRVGKEFERLVEDKATISASRS